MEGMLKKQNPHKNKVQDRYIHLFNDILIYSRPKSTMKTLLNSGQMYECKGVLPLKICLVTSMDEKLKNGSLGFNIVKLDNKRKYIFFAESEAKKNEWVQTLDELINGFLETEKKRSSVDFSAVANLINATLQPTSNVNTLRQRTVSDDPLPPAAESVEILSPEQSSAMIRDLQNRVVELEIKIEEQQNIFFKTIQFLETRIKQLETAKK